MSEVSARLREFLRDRAFRPEPQWCHELPDGFDHWPSTLRQRVRVTDSGEGVLRVMAVSDCVRDVADSQLADDLCSELTELAGGWSLVHDPLSAAVVATVAGVLDAEDEAALACWLDAAVMSAWHAWAVADALARAVGGEAAVTAPATADGPRKDVDGLLRLPEALRSRPEWVFDPEQLRLVALPDMAQRVAEALPVPMVVRSADHEACVLEVGQPWDEAVGWPSGLVMELVERPGIGYGLVVRAGGPCGRAAALARELNGCALAGDTDLAPGVWTTGSDGLWFGTFAAGFTVARLVRGDDGSLSGIAALAHNVWASAAAVADLVAEAGRAGEAVGESAPEPAAAAVRPGAAPAAALALSLQAATWQPALTAVGQALRGLGPIGSDDRLLWLPEADGETVAHVATWGRIDPPGPALTTLLLVGGSAVPAHLLVVLDRHPTSPHHRVCAAIGEGGSLTQAVHDVARAELKYLPGFVDQTDAPGHLRDAAAAGLIAAIDAASGTGSAEATAGAESPAQWWSAAIDRENVLQHYLALPAAWDAALSTSADQNPGGAWDPR